MDNKAYQSDEHSFQLVLPILLGLPTHANVLTAYNKQVSYRDNTTSLRYMLLNEQGNDESVSIQESEPILLKSWADESGNLGANQFLLKLDRITPTFDKAKVLSPIWNNFFSLNMDNFFGKENMQDGEFRVKVYTSLNAPLLTSTDLEEIYFPTTGIAIDKCQVTFFSFYSEAAIKNYQDFNYELIRMAINTGKFRYKVNENETAYTSPEQAIGFLYQFVNNNRISDYRLAAKEYAISASNEAEKTPFLHYEKIGNQNSLDDFMDNFEAISFSHAEYDELIRLKTASLAADIADSDDYVLDHPMFLLSDENRINTQNKFTLVETLATLGVVKAVENLASGTFELDFVPYPAPVQPNGQDLLLNSITFH